MVATLQAQKVQLFLGFHPFCDHLQAEFVAQFNGFQDHDPVAIVDLHIQDERFVDLEFRRRYVLELLHHGIAGAKIVDRQLNLFHPQSGQDVQRARQFFNQATLCDFNRDTPRRNAMLLGE